jgi:hypothetical protein
MRQVKVKTVGSVPLHEPEVAYTNASMALSWESNVVLHYTDDDKVSEIEIVFEFVCVLLPLSRYILLSRSTQWHLPPF